MPLCSSVRHHHRHPSLPPPTTEHHHMHFLRRIPSRIYKPFNVVYPFPTAFVDCLSGYNCLVYEVGYREENILVVGDLADRNLALALDPPKLKQPGTLLLLSPWVDLSDSHTTLGSSILTNSASDYDIYEPSPSWPQTAYLQPHGYGIADFNEYISPASLLLGVRSQVVGSYRGWPKTCLAAGGADLLFDEIRTLKEDMGNDMGKDLLDIERKDASYDSVLWEWHEPERSETLADIEKWLVILSIETLCRSIVIAFLLRNSDNYHNYIFKFAFRILYVNAANTG
ncbi:hypothetical protein DL96DRAFT_1781429 [Flagelloscypha sp. PMI_526]|nr:hypothetical protein DL96DRAFT_1781429 [Flagelloscypha sp. PMI_526]